MRAIDQALSDMRAGLSVMVIPGTRDAIVSLLAQVVTLPHERIRHARGDQRITSPSGGWIVFHSYPDVIRGAGRGYVLDRVYIDHAELCDELLPTMARSPDGPSITHIP